MIRSSVRSAGLALLIVVNGCGDLGSSGTGARLPGLNVAEAALQGGSGQIALQVSDGVLRGSPNNARALEIKADALSLLGDYEQAAHIFQSLLLKDPNSSRATIGLGRIMLSKQPAAAEALFQKALTHDPKDTTALNNLGIARDLQGRHTEAQTAYRQALAVSPDLDSAQANLALSMAMSGQGAAAVQLLKDKAMQPGVSAKVKHDYAVVLAMTGNRGEAERILDQDMAPDDARQVLDNVTGTHTRPAPEPSSTAVASRDWDTVPPDVVQVPEPAAQTAVPGPAAMVVAPAGPALAAASANATPTDASTRALPPGATPMGASRAAAMAATMAAPAPAVVRPRQPVGDDSGAPSARPANPVAAEVTDQQSLAAPIPNGFGKAAAGGTFDAAPEQASDTPAAPVSVRSVQVAVVQPPMVETPTGQTPMGQTPMGQTGAMQFGAASSDAAAVGGPFALPETPATTPVMRPVPLPGSYKPLKTAAQVPPVALTAPVEPVASRSAAARTPEPSAVLVHAPEAPTMVSRTDVTRTEAAWTEATRQDNARTVNARTDAAPPDATRMDRAHADVARSDPAPLKTTMPDRSDAATVLAAAHVASEMTSDAGSRTATGATAAVAIGATTTGAIKATATDATHDGDAAVPRAALATGYDSVPAVQFAATGSEVSARLFWQALVHRFPDALAQREPVVVRYVREGEVFWRVRTEGFVNLAEAQTLCAQMRADGQPCFVPRS